MSSRPRRAGSLPDLLAWGSALAVLVLPLFQVAEAQREFREYPSFEGEDAAAELPPDWKKPADFVVGRLMYPSAGFGFFRGRALAGGPGYLQGGRIPHWRGIYDDEGRLMVLIAFNNDVADAWQWADDPRYPGDQANRALRLGVNAAIYALTH